MKSYDLLRSVSAILLALALTGCTDKAQTITGTVVDESGNPLGNVTVMACYLGWGWSGDQLVWDKRVCSEPSLTSNAGTYTIRFKGSAHMTLHATKENWLQLQDFHNRSPRIILASLTQRNAQRRAQERTRESAFRQRQPGESETAYYCRVILARTSSVTASYWRESISITQGLLSYADTGDVLFALRGSSDAARSFINEVRLVINGEQLDVDFTLRPDTTACDPNTHIVQAKTKSSGAMTDERIELLLPSIRAAWGMEIWQI